MKQHNLVPAAFRFGVKITDEGDQATFEAGLAQFREEAPLCAAAGFVRTAMHILPWSLTEVVPFGQHFRMAVERLKLVAPILREHNIHLGCHYCCCCASPQLLRLRARVSGQLWKPTDCQTRLYSHNRRCAVPGCCGWDRVTCRTQGELLHAADWIPDAVMCVAAGHSPLVGYRGPVRRVGEAAGK